MDRKANREVFGIDKTSEEIRKDLETDEEDEEQTPTASSPQETSTEPPAATTPQSEAPAPQAPVAPQQPPAQTQQPAPTAPSPQTTPGELKDGTTTEINGVTHIAYGGQMHPVAVPGGYSMSRQVPQVPTNPPAGMMTISKRDPESGVLLVDRSDAPDMSPGSKVGDLRMIKGKLMSWDGKTWKPAKM